MNNSEGAGAGEGEELAGCWMDQSEGAGMEHQARGSHAVEAVAHDGAVQPLGMRTVDAQLVGAAGEGR